MRLCFVTGNGSKFTTAKNILSSYGIDLIQVEVPIYEPRSEDISFISKQKAIQAGTIIHEPLIVEDSGLFINSLNGFPGSFINHALKTIGVHGIFALLRDKPKDCEFRFTLTYWTPTGVIEQFNFVNPGMITEMFQNITEINTEWSDLSKIFVPQGFNNTLSSMNAMQREQYEKSWAERSHFRKFGEWLVKNIN